MSFKIKNFWDNDDVKVISQEKGFTVIEYQKDLSVTPDSAQIAYFSGLMDIRRKTLMCDLKVSDVTIQPGAMQFMVGDVQATTGIKGAGDFLKKSAGPHLRHKTPTLLLESVFESFQIILDHLRHVPLMVSQISE